ncbi:biotin/lipoate A/B protein ligase family protein [Paraconexibacter sp.]|uniref:lipoate--protein ligase family protein n=1 Tax=Paraconexibacter sp. TaxID=2949640 RepID=UPI0035689354
MALRVIDAGRVSPLRSQALWHGIASAMTDGDDPVLSLCIPSDPYVGIGYHRRLEELDLRHTGRRRIRVIRRRIGGGPVWLDSDQLFFQLTAPAGKVSPVVSRLYEDCLGPAVDAFRSLGLDARLHAVNDIVVGDRKISGTGAGRIADAVTVVGNVILRFPYEQMVEVLALPCEEMRAEVARLMRRHVASLSDLGRPDVDHAQAAQALVETYTSWFGPSVHGALRPEEEREVLRWEDRMSSPQWLRGPGLPERPARTVKVRAGLHVAWAQHDGVELLTTITDGVITRARVRARDDARSPTDTDRAVLLAAAPELEKALVGAGATAASARERLGAHGDPGRRVGEALSAALGWRD